MPRAGERDRPITIEQDTGVTRDTDGAEIDGWVAFKSVWAKKVSIGGSEGETGEGRSATATVQWELQYTTSLDPVRATKFRVNDHGVLFDITYVDDTRKRQGELVLMTTQRGA